MDLVDGLNDMSMLQRRHWLDAEKNVLTQALLSGAMEQNTHPSSVPPDLLRQLPGRSAESVRQYTRKHYHELMANALGCVEFLDLCEQEVEKQSPKASPKKRARASKTAPASKPPPAPQLTAVEEPAPPMMRPPLPRALTHGAKRMRIEAHGFLATYLCELPGSSFDDINRSLAHKHRDARTENWDGMPRFM